MIKKIKIILDFLKELENEIDFNQIEFVDYWDSDLSAIGIKRGEKLIYLATWNNDGDDVITFNYDFEILNEVEIDKLNVIKSVEGATASDLIADLRNFFEI